ncbi:MAG: hypothetical protein IJM38_02110 [Ruminococcus sp.]|nr:hypothetical protein [Ruminococcus sp.]
MKKSMKSLLHSRSAVERIAGSYPAADRRTEERIYKKTMEKVRTKLDGESEHSDIYTVTPVRSVRRFRTAAMAAAVVLVIGATICGAVFRFRPDPKKKDDPRPVIVEEHTRSSQENEKNEVTTDTAETQIVTTSAAETTRVTETMVVTHNEDNRVIYTKVIVADRGGYSTETTVKNYSSNHPTVTVKGQERKNTVTTAVTGRRETKSAVTVTTYLYGPYNDTSTTTALPTTTAPLPTTTYPYGVSVTTVDPRYNEIVTYLETINPKNGAPYVDVQEAFNKRMSNEKIAKLAEVRKDERKDGVEYPFREYLAVEDYPVKNRLDLDIAIREIFVTYCNNYELNDAINALSSRQKYPDATYYENNKKIDIYNVSSNGDLYIDHGNKTIKYCGNDKKGIYIERYLFGNNYSYPDPFVSVSAAKLQKIREYINSGNAVYQRKVMQMAGELSENAPRITPEQVKNIVNSTLGTYADKAKAIYTASGGAPDIISYYGDNAVYYLDDEYKSFVMCARVIPGSPYYGSRNQILYFDGKKTEVFYDEYSYGISVY